ncbi:hypothetical protein NADFUDRAFT_49261 [Nadsonia fulvescens var. elongata DSM 6958]|uniref:Golgi pH regulator n=1 Tax=Nadsonia fulvescens var. elongata DSM 6958 TaxID=857566 RepID=A0A1E3PUI8_9ASCO|nr:hypothetical protein NADFUDRAFT_49261 [Nadsonia fulvescens var. elongata DSM 6958]
MASASLNSSSHHGIAQARIRTLFAITITCSAVVVQLVLCEIVKWCDPDLRVMVWKTTVMALNALLIFILPFTEIYIFLLKYWPALTTRTAQISQPPPKSASTIARKIIALVAFLTWLFFFYHIGDFLPIKRTKSVSVAVSSASSSAPLNLSQNILARTTFIGVTLMAILSGVGAVAAPFFSFFNFSQRQVTQADLDRLARSVESLSLMTDFKQTEFNQLRQHHTAAISSLNDNLSPPVKSLSASTSNLVKKMIKFTVYKEDTIQDDIRYEYEALELEINSLAKVKYNLKAELQKKRSQFEAQSRARTTIGKLFSIAYMMFSVYCIYRLITCMVMRNPLWYKFYHGSIFHALKSSSRKSDALSVTLAHIIANMTTPAALKDTPFYAGNVDAWSRQIGFALSGGLFLGSVSSVVTTFKTLIKLIPVVNQTNQYLQRESLLSHSASFSTDAGNHKSSASSLRQISLGVLLTSQITGTYVLATTLLLRSNLPDEMSKSITVALGSPLDVKFIDSWFDIVFGFTTMATLVGLYLSKKYQSLDKGYESDLDNSFMYDEESYLDNTKYA